MGKDKKRKQEASQMESGKAVRAAGRVTEIVQEITAQRADLLAWLTC